MNPVPAHDEEAAHRALHEIAIINIVWCMTGTRGVGGG